MPPNPENPQVISYLTLRKLIGVLGVLLPVILVLGCFSFGPCKSIQDSISDYYHTNMRDVFVGILFAIGLFLFSYKGYDDRDNIAGNLACLFALGVALFPTGDETSIISIIHFASATLLFMTLSYFCFFLFTLCEPGPPTSMKIIRNRVYRTCGGVILMCIFLIAVYMWFLSKNFPNLANFQPVFWLESIALWAFGFSWLIKGETLLRDQS